MPATRTAAFEVDDATEGFEASLEVCKAYEDKATGKRYIEGVATGVLEDADGERVSKNAIRKIARQAVSGLKLTSSHQQDWATEIGDLVRVAHDPEADELVVKCELPPEGEDALADKAWLRQTRYGEKLAFSIGGKLRKFFYEQNEVGKRRKVLDDIDLRHVMLTKKPAYRPSFALAVAKSLSETDEPADDAFNQAVEADEPEAIVVEKVLVEKDSSSVSQDPEEEGPGGEKGKKKIERDVDDDQNDETTPAADLPKARRLACPNCGHEFAADMPADTEPPADGGERDNNHRDAHKTAPEESDMPETKANDVLASIRELVTQDEAVEKQEPETPEEPTVEKTPTDASEIEKMLAASHTANRTAIEELAEKTAESLQIVAKAVKGIQEAVASTPQGRKSLARITEGIPTRAEVEAGAGGEVAKTRTDSDEIEKRIEETEDPLEAIKLGQARSFGVASTGVEVPTAA